jgi:hypothetical protein
MKSRTINLITAALVAPLLVATAAPASADWLGLAVGDDGFALSIGVGSWDAYSNDWYDPGWAVDFHASLDGYGSWVWVDGLGQVWRPYVAADWRPYTYGRWVYTNLGWTWVSYEPWGYLPHHYGDWALTSYGWVWVPGYTFRPANVVWVSFGTYVGWYPAGPTGWSHSHHGFWQGYNHGYRNGYNHGYDNGYWNGWRDARYATYVPWNRMDSDDIAHYSMDSRQVGRSLTQATVQPMRSAPERSDVMRRTGRDLPEVQVEQRQVQVDGRTVTMARPQGVSRTVATHAQETVERALAPQAVRRVEQDVARSSRRVAPSAAPASPPRTQARTVETQAPATSGRTSTESREVIAPRTSRTTSQPEGIVPASRQAPSPALSSRPSRPASQPAPSTSSSSRRTTVVERPATTAPSRSTGTGTATSGSSRPAAPIRTVVQQHSAAAGRTAQPAPHQPAPSTTASRSRATSSQPSRAQAAPRTATQASKSTAQGRPRTTPTPKPAK